jgi:hypothetical protein
VSSRVNFSKGDEKYPLGPIIGVEIESERGQDGRASGGESMLIRSVAQYGEFQITDL